MGAGAGVPGASWAGLGSAGRPRRSARARHQAPSAPCGGYPRSNWPARTPQPRPGLTAAACGAPLESLGNGGRCQTPAATSRACHIGVRHPMHIVSSSTTVRQGCLTPVSSAQGIRSRPTRDPASPGPTGTPGRLKNSITPQRPEHFPPITPAADMATPAATSPGARSSTPVRAWPGRFSWAWRASPGSRSCAWPRRPNRSPRSPAT